MPRRRMARPIRSVAAKQSLEKRESADEQHAGSGDQSPGHVRAEPPDGCSPYYKEVFENTSDAIVVGEVAEDGGLSILDCNPAWARMTGKSCAEMVGRVMGHSGSPVMSSLSTGQAFARCIETGEEVELDQDLDTPLGHRWFRTTLIPVLNPSGRVYRIVGVGRDITAEKLAESERLARVRFLECMDRVNTVLQRDSSLESVFSDLLDLLLSIFSCDRAFMLYPCDLDTQVFTVVMQRSAPEYPGEYVTGAYYPVVPGQRETFSRLLRTDGPVTYGPGMDVETPPETEPEIGFLTGIAMAVRPRGDSPYMFGLHQCSYHREWTDEDRTLFEAISRRVGDGLSTLLAYRSLEKSERRLRLTLANSPDVIAVQDAELRYTWMSSPASAGQTEDVVGKTDEDLLPASEARYLTEIKRQVLSSGDSYHEEIPSHIAGELRWHDTYIEPLRDDDGRTIGVSYYARDVSTRKQAEESLKRSEDRYRTIFQNSPLGIFRATPEGRLIECNPALAELLGYDSPDDVMSETPGVGGQLLTHAESLQAPDSTPNGTPEFTQHYDTFRRKDGGEFVANLYLKKVADARGEPIYFEGIIEDITDRTRAEDALQKIAKYTRSVFEASPDPFLTVSAGGIIADANRAMEQFAGVRREQLVGIPFVDCFTDPQQAAIALRRTIDEGSLRDFSIGMRGPAGERRSVRMNATAFDVGSPDTSEPGSRGVLAAMYDVSQLEAAQARTHEVLVEMIEAIGLTIEMRDPATFGHQQRVAALASSIAEQMGLDEEQVEAVRMGALIHDVGKLHIPAEILAKPGPFTPDEWKIVKTHPTVGAEVMRGVHTPWAIEQMLLQHHERLDGSGYPNGLSGRGIALEARILAVADVVEAMSTDRPDRVAPGIEAALEEVARGRGTLFDQRAVDACVALFRQHAFTFSASIHGSSRPPELRKSVV